MKSTQPPSLAAAEQSVADKASTLLDDPQRPVYHFRPPCCWMNDPNGVIFHNGFFHVFYQFNPYGDAWGNIHWGHTRSADLVHWEHLPIALWPSTEQGEAHCYSGCAAIAGDGQPMLHYTSVAPEGERPFEQWAALGDADLLTWRKHPVNPFLALGAPQFPDFDADWRDPFLFSAQGRTFMALGAATAEQANVALFETEDPGLVDWRYRGLIYSRPRREMRFCECPNFFPLGDKFVLLLSPYRPVEYTVGDFDPDTPAFLPDTHGILDPGVSRLDHRGSVTANAENANYYATNILYDADGNCILFGWIRGFRTGQGWNGCLALPRLLTLGPDGHPRQQPVPALQQLRGTQLVETSTLRLDDEAQALTGVTGDTLELHIDLTLETATRAGLRLRAGADGSRGLPIEYDGRVLRVHETLVELPHNPRLTLQVFLDKTVTEVFVNDGTRAITQVAYPMLEDQHIWLYAEGGAALFTDLRAWELSPIW